MNHRITFVILIILFIASLMVSTVQTAPLFSAIKALLIGVYFMELNLAHRAWFLAYSGLIMVVTASIYIFV